MWTWPEAFFWSVFWTLVVIVYLFNRRSRR